MRCKLVCQKYKKKSRYDSSDSRFCSQCSIFIRWEGLRCPCCSIILKQKPRTSRTLRTYNKRNPKKEPKRII